VKQDIEPLHTIADVMGVLRCGRKKVYELGRRGDLKLVKFDSGTRVTDASLRKLLDDINKKRLA